MEELDSEGPLTSLALKLGPHAFFVLKFQDRHAGLVVNLSEGDDKDALGVTTVLHVVEPLRQLARLGEEFLLDLEDLGGGVGPGDLVASKRLDRECLPPESTRQLAPEKRVDL